jgi:hypothetical protein
VTECSSKFLLSNRHALLLDLGGRLSPLLGVCAVDAAACQPIARVRGRRGGQEAAFGKGGNLAAGARVSPTLGRRATRRPRRLARWTFGLGLERGVILSHTSLLIIVEPRGETATICRAETTFFSSASSPVPGPKLPHSEAIG